MSAKMMITQAQADDGFSLLKDIVAMVKNPDAIDDAYKRRLEAAKLTDDEVAKAASARALIEKADSLKDALQKRESSLQAAEIAHGSAVEEHRRRVQADTDKLKKLEEQLQIKEDSHTANVSKLIAERDKLNSDAQLAKELSAAKEQELADRERSIESMKVAQKAESDRLEEIRKKQKEKAERLAREAAKDE